MLPVAAVCVQLKSRMVAIVMSTLEPTTGAVLYGSVFPPGPGPVDGTAVFSAASESQNPCQKIFPALPTTRTVPTMRRYQGTFVLATTLSGIASVSIAAVPATPKL